MNDLNNMQNKEQSCRHEYVKMFQRKYKGLGRRWVSTRGYLPVGFGAKDFSTLSTGSYCFCTRCRMRLFPVRLDPAKLNRLAQLRDNQSKLAPASNPEEANLIQEEEIWIDENNSDYLNAEEEELKEEQDLKVVNVEELQVESVDISDIADNKVIVSGESDAEEEEGEE